MPATRSFALIAAASLCACQLSGPLPLEGGATATSGTSSTGTSNGSSTGGSATSASSTSTPLGSSSGGSSARTSNGSASTGSTSSGSSSGGSNGSGFPCALPGFKDLGPQTTYTVGNAPYALAVGDFDEDGRLDIAVANSCVLISGNPCDAGSVGVLLNQGGGAFGAQTVYQTGGYPVSIAVGDLNGDGAPDLAVAIGKRAVAVLLNQGSGKFGAASTYAVGSAVSVAIADFNRDGQEDLAVADVANNSVDVLLNQGNATFPAYTQYAAGVSPTGVAVGDFNGDGFPDLAVANSNLYGDAGTVSVLLNKGFGDFGSQATYGVGAIPDSVAVGDFNGDGKPDLAVANGGSTFVSLLLNRGDGTFASPVDYDVGLDPTSVAVGDFAGDGTLGLAVAVYGANQVTVLSGAGNGALTLGGIGAVGSAPQGVAVGDFNGDGRADVAAANSDAGTVSVLLNVGAGQGQWSFAAPVAYATGENPDALAVADFDGDGQLDLAISNQSCFFPDGGGDQGCPGTVSVLLNQGDGTFAGSATYAVENTPVAIAVGDFNGDGRPDLAVANENVGVVSILMHQADGGFADQVTYAVGASPVAVALADFDGDGVTDLAVANFAGASVSLLLGLGDGGFSAQTTFAAGQSPTSLAVADFNGDGKPDVAVAGYCEIGDGGTCPGTAGVLFNLGNGTLSPLVAYPAGDGTAFIAVGDFNGDGKPDLVAANHGSNSVSVLLNLGDGGFADQVTYAAEASALSLAVGDFNGDGAPDIVVPSFNNPVAFLVNQGNGTFAPGPAALAGLPGRGSPIAVAVGDFNRDGLLDVVFANYDAANVTVLLNQCGP